jgi:hypothetical protein
MLLAVETASDVFTLLHESPWIAGPLPSLMFLPHFERFLMQQKSNRNSGVRNAKA